MEAVIQRIPARLLGLFLVVTAMVGCAISPPVQEMSDARQAIRAAQDAQADRHAPAALNQAEELLTRATRSLEQGEYENARQAALAAKQKAIAARDRAVEASGAGP
jgi:predicted S18 family serine protease